METKVSKMLIEDIFGIPADGKNIQDEDEDTSLGVSSTESAASFDTKVAEVREKVAAAKAAPLPSGDDAAESKQEKPVEKKKLFGDLFDDDEPVVKPAKPDPVVAPKSETVRVDIKVDVAELPKVAEIVKEKVAEAVAKLEEKPAEKVEEKKVVTEKKEVEKVEFPVPDRPPAPTVDFDSMPEPPKEERKRVTPKAYKAPVVETVAEDDDEDATDGPCEQWSQEDVWLLDSPAPKYNKFYQEKAMALRGSRNILQGGEVPFTKYFNELAELNCDVTVQTADLEAIHNKMQQVQQLRERLRHIQQHVDQQYYMWERYIELFHGVLCRIEYERGKQDGLYYDHMRDMEHYYCSLKALHRIGEQVMRTLDGAFECLSRQVTIAMPMREAERHFSTNPQSAAKPITQEMKRFDSLPNANSKATAKEDSGIPKGWDL